MNLFGSVRAVVMHSSVSLGTFLVCAKGGIGTDSTWVVAIKQMVVQAIVSRTIVEVIGTVRVQVLDARIVSVLSSDATTRADLWMSSVLTSMIAPKQGTVVQAVLSRSLPVGEHWAVASISSTFLSRGITVCEAAIGTLGIVILVWSSARSTGTGVQQRANAVHSGVAVIVGLAHPSQAS